MKLTIEQKEANKLARKAARELEKETARIDREKNQKPVRSIEISIEWKKSRTWGSNPHLEAHIRHTDGTHSHFTSTCSGCGYDKESTVIADLFNQVLKYKLWQITDEQFEASKTADYGKGIPYGIHSYRKEHRSFGGGIGTNCYYGICKFIGFELKRVASGKTYDAYTVNEIL